MERRNGAGRVALRRARVRTGASLGLALSALLTLLVAGSSRALTIPLELETSSLFIVGSGIAVSSSPGLYPAGTVFQVEIGAAGADSRSFELSEVTIPTVPFSFGNRFEFRLETPLGVPTDRLRLDWYPETGRVETPPDEPMRLRMQQWQGVSLLAEDTIDIALTTGTLIRPPCGDASSAPVVGSPLGEDFLLVGAICVNTFAEINSFNQPVSFRLAGRSFSTVCIDGIDNDADGRIDFPEDPGCSSAADSSEAPICDDGIDNDGDGRIDFPSDLGCTWLGDADELADFACDDGLDNDGDGRTDFPDDPECRAPSGLSERAACSDGLDNDGDGATDLSDPGCEGPGDPDERADSAPCDDGIDNDGDGATDLADASCAVPGDPSEAPACSDFFDNDGDGLVDLSDPGCLDAADLDEQDAARACDDGQDNDGDGDVDFPADAECESPGDVSEAARCDDGQDNDGDGRVDFGSDPGCQSRHDASELDPHDPCDNGLDDDGDALVDGDDPQCADLSSAGEAAACADRVDNDGDGRVDHPSDPGCANPDDDSERDAALPCDDEADADGDGDAAYPQDPGCASPADPSELAVCSDGVDNDGDGAIDHPDDPECADAFGHRETLPACSDGEDNDGDGALDLEDPDCPAPEHASESAACSNGLDDDADGFVDLADPGCASGNDLSELDTGSDCDDGVDNDGDGQTDFAEDGGCVDPADASEEPDCSDGLDNDGDGDTDDADPGCESDLDPDERDGGSECDDGRDNDLDDDVDIDDRDCFSPRHSSESPDCADGLDNDDDGFVDFPLDPGCRSLNDSSEKGGPACDDRRDNDDDGAADFPDDRGCEGPGDELEEGVCQDGIDQDGDGLVDGDDPGCTTFFDFSERSSALPCDDGLDNDGDGGVDFPADPECVSPAGASEWPQCSDQLDNDGDGYVDVGGDPGCADAADPSERAPGLPCDDGVDNDGDGLTDLADPHCLRPGDDSERAACDDGLDNDGDLAVDLLDPGCSDPEDRSERAPALPCDDGLDNDGDGLTDLADPACDDPRDPAETRCGDGVVEGAETCDDGNLQDGDCCSASCTAEAFGNACDDGNLCTQGDVCDGTGSCNAGSPRVCDDGLFCNGAESCDPLVGCQPGVAPQLDDGVGCTEDSCDEASDVVLHQARHSLCDDGLFCSGEERCDPVLDCQVGTPPPVDDGVACTADSCDEEQDAVVHRLDDAACDDALFCNGAETCDALLGCVAGAAPEIDDGVSCTLDSCDEEADLVRHLPDVSRCDDGFFCNGAERCDPVLDCQAGSDPADDGVACTLDVCDEVADAVSHEPRNALCGDGLFCNGEEVCDALLGCRAGEAPEVDDGVECTFDVCLELDDRVIHMPMAGFCDDGSFCNGSEVCDLQLGCQQGEAPSLDDGVSCTADSCDEAADAVVHIPEAARCDDGLFCTGEETCDLLLDCQVGTAPALDDGVSCTADFCDEEADAVVHRAESSACDDGLFCNGSEFCDPLLDCRPGPAPVRDDGVACTVDSCDEDADRVVHEPRASLCDDGAFCNGSETCDALLGCQPGIAPTIDDGIACTTDGCDEASDQIVHVALDFRCDDGLFCNGSETCDSELGCRPGSPPEADDGVFCTADACDEGQDRVVHLPRSSMCDDGLFCNGAERCDPVLDCQPSAPPTPDDGVACTLDRCDEESDRIVNAPDAGRCPEPSRCQAASCDPLEGCRVESIPDCNPHPFVAAVASPPVAEFGEWVEVFAVLDNPGKASPSFEQVDVIFYLASQPLIVPSDDPMVGSCQIAAIGPEGRAVCSTRVKLETPSLVEPAGPGGVLVHLGACAELMQEASVAEGSCRSGAAIRVPEPASAFAGLAGLLAVWGLTASRRRRSGKKA